MSILYLGMDGLATEFLFDDERVSEQLIHFHQLIDMGCFGILKSEDASGVRKTASLGKLPVWKGNQRIIPAYETPNLKNDDWDSLVNEVISLSTRQFDELIEVLAADSCNYLEYMDAGLSQIYTAWAQVGAAGKTASEPQVRLQDAVRKYYLHLDAQLVKIFEGIQDEIVLAIVSDFGQTSSQPGFFILAASDSPLVGELTGVKRINIGPTLLELAGYPLSEDEQQVSLVFGLQKSGSSEKLSDEEEEILRERLSGLGYIS